MRTRNFLYTSLTATELEWFRDRSLNADIYWTKLSFASADDRDEFFEERTQDIIKEKLAEFDESEERQNYYAALPAAENSLDAYIVMNRAAVTERHPEEMPPAATVMLFPVKLNAQLPQPLPILTIDESKQDERDAVEFDEGTETEESEFNEYDSDDYFDPFAAKPAAKAGRVRTKKDSDPEFNSDDCEDWDDKHDKNDKNDKNVVPKQRKRAPVTEAKPFIQESYSYFAIKQYSWLAVPEYPQTTKIFLELKSPEEAVQVLKDLKKMLEQKQVPTRDIKIARSKYLVVADKRMMESGFGRPRTLSIQQANPFRVRPLLGAAVDNLNKKRGQQRKEKYKSKPRNLLKAVIAKNPYYFCKHLPNLAQSPASAATALCYAVKNRSNNFLSLLRLNGVDKYVNNGAQLDSMTVNVLHVAAIHDQETFLAFARLEHADFLFLSSQKKNSLDYLLESGNRAEAVISEFLQLDNPSIFDALEQTLRENTNQDSLSLLIQVAMRDNIEEVLNLIKSYKRRDIIDFTLLALLLKEGPEDLQAHGLMPSFSLHNMRYDQQQSIYLPLILVLSIENQQRINSLMREFFANNHPAYFRQFIILEENRKIHGKIILLVKSNAIPALADIVFDLLMGHIKNDKQLTEDRKEANRQRIDLYCQYGINLDKTTVEGETPLSCAVRAGNLPVIQYLVERGVAITEKAYQIAVEVEDPECISYFISLRTVLVQQYSQASLIARYREFTRPPARMALPAAPQVQQEVKEAQAMQLSSEQEIGQGALDSVHSLPRP